MSRRHRTLGLVGVLLCTILPLFAVPPEQKEGLVYRLESYTPNDYARVDSPPEVEKLFLIASTNNALDARHTLVYYWPLTNEYFESWDKLDLPAGGHLEVTQGGRIIASLNRVPVALRQSQSGSTSHSTLLFGEKATQEYHTFSTMRQKYDRELERYSSELIRYDAQLRTNTRQTETAEGHNTEPVKPTEPTPPPWYVTKPQKEFVLNLSPGVYQIRLRDRDGAIVEGSERLVRAFAPIATHLVGFNAFSEQRWTQPIPSDRCDSTIYCTPGQELFLIPYSVVSYDGSYFSRLRDPQSANSVHRAAYLHIAPLRDLHLVETNGVGKRVVTELKPFVVSQIAGADLGYTISEYVSSQSSSEAPNFSAYRLHIAPSDGARSIRLALNDSTNGAVIDSSRRTIRVVGRQNRLPLWGVALSPGIVGIGLVFWRKRKDHQGGVDL